jgi:REP element-mobilizing transposase RayT
MKLPRFHIDGHIYYITTNIYARLPLFTKASYVIALVDSLNFYRYQYDFKLLGYVIMPDHIHLIIWPQGQARVADLMRDFKTFTSKRIIRQASVERAGDLLAAFECAGKETGRSEHKVWQDSYWDKNIYTESFLRQKLNYIHRNPVHGGLVQEPKDYLYSSYRNYACDEHWLIDVDCEWR